MQLDPKNKAFNLALDLVQYTDRNLFLTGKAGTGKTTFLKALHNYTDKNIAVVAPTGVAAVNAGGVTIHSFFRLGVELYPPTDRRIKTAAAIRNNFTYNDARKKVFEELELLVIDEVSMVRCEMLDLIDRILKVYGGGNSAAPFGGKQVVFIGDPFQLPPVVKKEAREILRPHYPTFFFFSAYAFQDAQPVCIELQRIYRQNDPKFIDLLNKVRVNRMQNGALELLNCRVAAHPFTPGENNKIYLGTHNGQINGVNERELKKIDRPVYTYTAEVTGEFKSREMPTEQHLKLKIGAQVMFLVNDTTEHRYFNGKIGRVVDLGNSSVKVHLDGVGTMEVEQYQWKKIRYEWSEKHQKVEAVTVGTFTKYPLKLAWAITVHKSQGLTFEQVYANLGKSFASGQAYVGLSRCTSLEGIELASPIPPRAIKVDPSVVDFAQHFQEQNLSALEQEVSELKGNALLQQATQYLQSAKQFPLAMKVLQEALETMPDLDLTDFVLTALQQLVKQQIQIDELNDTNHLQQKQNTQLQRQLQQSRLTIESQQASIQQLQQSIAQMDGELSTNRQQCEEEKAELEQKITALEGRRWWQVLFGK